MPKTSKNTTSVKVGICIPSRGTMFSETMSSVWSNASQSGVNCELYMEHGVPIPRCFQKLIARAIKDDCTHIWFVEEDMLIPGFTLKRMLKMDEPFVAVDYADKRTGKPLAKIAHDGKVLFTGMGCLLVKTEVFKKVGIPFINTGTFWIVKPDKDWRPNSPEPGEILEYHPEAKTENYGTQDIWLCAKVRELGYDIKLIRDIPVGHMKLVKKGADGTNQGTDSVEVVYNDFI